MHIFINKLKKAAISYKNDIAVLTVFKNYADFLKNVKKTIYKKNEVGSKVQPTGDSKTKIEQPMLLVNGE